jgi:hypothetical protein
MTNDEIEAVLTTLLTESGAPQSADLDGPFIEVRCQDGHRITAIGVDHRSVSGRPYLLRVDGAGHPAAALDVETWEPLDAPMISLVTASQDVTRRDAAADDRGFAEVWKLADGWRLIIAQPPHEGGLWMRFFAPASSRSTPVLEAVWHLG